MAKVVTIQNTDRVVLSKDYHSLKDDELLVTSFFRTIQGEGPYAGHPAVFLRLAGCNFGNKDPEGMCSFCDTSFQFDQGRVYSFQDLLVEMMALPGYNRNDILVVTGGEPTLQHNLLQFILSLQSSVDHEETLFRLVQLETNGTQAVWFSRLDAIEQGMMDSDLSYLRPSIVVSPKASVKAGRYAEPSEVVKRLASCFKFVVTADESDPHHTVPEWALDMAWMKRSAVYVSPMAVYKKPYQGEVASAWDHELINAEETAKNYAYAAKFALENNLLVSIQQHLFLALP